jgi:hypothetical protein
MLLTIIIFTFFTFSSGFVITIDNATYSFLLRPKSPSIYYFFHRWISGRVIMLPFLQYYKVCSMYNLIYFNFLEDLEDSISDDHNLQLTFIITPINSPMSTGLSIGHRYVTKKPLSSNMRKLLASQLILTKTKVDDLVEIHFKCRIIQLLGYFILEHEKHRNRFRS